MGPYGVLRRGYGPLPAHHPVDWQPAALAARAMIPPDDFEIIMAHENTGLADDLFNVAEPVTLLASAANQTITDFFLSEGQLGVLRAFAMGVAIAADFDNIVWGVTLDGQRLPGLDSIRGPISTFIFPLPVVIPMPRGARVAIVATNLTAANILLVTGMLRGTRFEAGPMLRHPSGV